MRIDAVLRALTIVTLCAFGLVMVFACLALLRWGLP
jgi:hypothetical protein